MFSKFFDYSNNAESFAVDGQEISRSEYLKHLGNGNLSNRNCISSDFFIPDLEELKIDIPKYLMK